MYYQALSVQKQHNTSCLSIVVSSQTEHTYNSAMNVLEPLSQEYSHNHNTIFSTVYI